MFESLSPKRSRGFSGRRCWRVYVAVADARGDRTAVFGNAGQAPACSSSADA